MPLQMPPEQAYGSSHVLSQGIDELVCNDYLSPLPSPPPRGGGGGGGAITNPNVSPSDKVLGPTLLFALPLFCRIVKTAATM